MFMFTPFRGFAFVTFKSPEAVYGVIEQCNNGGHTLDGKVVSVLNHIHILKERNNKQTVKSIFCQDSKIIFT